MLLAELLSVLQDSAVVQNRWALLLLRRPRKNIESSLYLAQESARHQLLGTQVAPAVRALLPLLREPSGHAVLTSELRALGTQDGILYLAKANEALEDLIEPRRAARLGLFRLLDLSTLSVVVPVATRQGIDSMLPDVVEAVAHRYNIIVVVDIIKPSVGLTAVSVVTLTRHHKIRLKTPWIRRLTIISLVDLRACSNRLAL